MTKSFDIPDDPFNKGIISYVKRKDEMDHEKILKAHIDILKESSSDADREAIRKSYANYKSMGAVIWAKTIENYEKKSYSFDPWKDISLAVMRRLSMVENKNSSVPKGEYESVRDAISRRAIDGAVKLGEQLNAGGNVECLHLAFTTLFEVVQPWLTHDVRDQLCAYAQEWDAELEKWENDKINYRVAERTSSLPEETSW